MSTVIQTRIDEKSRAAAENIFRQMGMSLSDGIRIFICQVINEKGLPFQPTTRREFKDEIIQAMMDAKEQKNLIGPFENLNDLQEYLERNNSDEAN